MVSRTKYLLDNSTIKKLFNKAGINGITSISVLGAGEYNAVYEVIADKAYVLKIAPKSDVPVLTYEKDMMKSEVYWYKIIRENTDIRVPEVYFEDYSKELIPSDYFIMEKLEGKQRSIKNIDASVITEKTAKMVARIHNIHNDKFGYVQNDMYDSWYDALCSMIQNLIDDARRVGKRSKKGEKLLSYAHKYKAILTDVDCCMVNYDIWDANVLCSKNENGEIEFSWIDPERSFWGDRIFDFICLENPVGSIYNKKRTFAFYNTVCEKPIQPDKEIAIRYAFAQGLMGLIQEVEKHYRYTPHHFGWWRNVFSGAVFYRQGLGALKNG